MITKLLQGAFELTSRTCRDGSFYAKRSAVAKAISATKKSPLDTGLFNPYLRIRRRGKRCDVLATTTVSVELRYGRLRLGCHSFDRDETKILIRWAQKG